MASPHRPVHSDGRLVLLEPAMPFGKPRFMVAPAGARLPSGVQELALVAVAGSASSRAGAMAATAGKGVAFVEVPATACFMAGPAAVGGRTSRGAVSAAASGYGFASAPVPASSLTGLAGAGGLASRGGHAATYGVCYSSMELARAAIPAGEGGGASHGVASAAAPAGAAGGASSGFLFVAPGGQAGAGKRGASVVAKARHGPAGRSDGAEEFQDRSDVFRHWKKFEQEYAPLAVACVKADQVLKFEKTTTRGILMLNDILMAKTEWSSIDLKVVKAAGEYFRVADLQAKNGYMPLESIILAAQSINFVYTYVLIEPYLHSIATPLPPETQKVLIRLEEIQYIIPDIISDPDAYYDKLEMGLSALLDHIQKGFGSVKMFWSIDQ